MKFKEHRLEMGWSVRELARRLRCHKSVILRIEGGGYCPSEIEDWLERCVYLMRANSAPCYLGSMK